MRRFGARRRSGRSSGKRRKLYWGGLLAQAINLELNADEVVSFWVKWPSGLRSDTVEDGVGEVEPCDETWAKCNVNSTVEIRNQGGSAAPAAISLTVGLITWDAAVDPARFHEAVSNDTFPSPTLDFTKDWIIRQPYQFARDDFLFAATTAQFQESRAQRKLPPNTGVIGLVGVNSLVNDNAAISGIDFSIDFRYLLRAGYYQPNTFSR